MQFLALQEIPDLRREDLKERIKWLIIARASLMTLLFGATLLFQVGTVKSPLAFYFPSVLLGYIYLLTLGYFFLLNRMENLALLSIVQISIDVILETVLVMVTGSVESPFSFLYVLSIISGALLFNRLGAVGVASLAFFLYGLVVDLEYFGWGPFRYFTPPNMTEREILYSFFLYLVIFFTIAAVSGHLSGRLNRMRRDLDEQERGLTALKAFHENVVRSMGSGLLTADLEGRILSFNAAAESISGYSTDDVIHEKWWKVFGWAFAPESGEHSEMRHGVFRFDREGRRKNGNRILVGMTLTPLRNEFGIQTGIVGTFQDLTKIREMEEAIRLKERLAHLGEMAAGIAHEIRNPLASLTGSMEVLKEELELRDHQEKLMAIALKEADRLNHLISDFLNYARPRNPESRSVELRSFLEEEIFFFRNSGICPPSIRIELVMDPELTYVRFDPNLMKQVFWNLFINAGEAMPEGGDIRVSAGMETGYAERPSWFLLVEDTGTGIEAEVLPRIFNPFYSTKDHGTGLGLSIVHRIVEEHGGKITASGSPGGGAVFRIRLPLNSEHLLHAEDQKRESLIG